MYKYTTRMLLTLFAAGCFFIHLSMAQTPSEMKPLVKANRYSWENARSRQSNAKKLYVVTVDEPEKMQSCRVKSLSEEKLECARAFGETASYEPGQLVALIIPGDGNTKIQWVLGLNGGMGAAIWGTVVLAAACPVCAVATGIAALLFFDAAGAILIGDDAPNALLYLAPGKELSEKLGYVRSE